VSDRRGDAIPFPALPDCSNCMKAKQVGAVPNPRLSRSRPLERTHAEEIDDSALRR
jgi:hypothetical protein